MSRSTGHSGALERIVAVGVRIASASVLAIMLIGTLDIVATMLGRPLPGAFELIQTLMVLIIFLALPAVEAKRQHISVDLIYQHMPAPVQRAASVGGQTLALVFFGAMAWQGWKLFWESWLIREYASGFVAFPIYPAKGMFALGVTVASVMALVNLADSLARHRTSG